MLQQTMEREIDQRPLARFLLSQGELEFRRLLDKLPAGAYMCDPDGLITYFNQRAVEVWGRAPKLNDPVDRFCGSFKLFSPDGSPIRHDQCWMALALRENVEYNGYEIVIERPAGDCITTLAYANPIRDESGKLLGAVNVLVDITNRKRAEMEREQLLGELDKEHVRLGQLTETLEGRVLERTAQVRDLASALNLAEERERGRISRILHDDLQQLLYSQLMRLEMLRSSLPAEQKVALADLTSSMVDQLNQAIHTTRTLAAELNRPKMETSYLVEALQWLVAHMEQAHGLRVAFTTHGPAVTISDEARNLLLQIASELLFNVVKHAGTDQVRLELSRNDNRFTICIEDDGVGFDLSALSADSRGRDGIGIHSISQRLSLIGGRLEIDTAPGAGTRATIYAPAQ
jgi:PAS domain S-box-containing protein